MNSAATSVRRLDDHLGQRRIVQNYLLVWLHADVTTSNEDPQRTLEHLRSVVNDVTVFTQPEECVTFLQGVQLEKVFLIVPGSLGPHLVPDIHAMKQLDSIYILSNNKSRHEEWVKEWPKVKDAFTQIKPISKSLELAVKKCEQDCAAISFASISTKDAPELNLNQLEPSFMYTLLFKNTLLNMKHDRAKAVTDLVKYCQQVYAANPAQLALVNEFSRDYQPDQAVWWYTRETFTYQMLNRALRLLEADIIVNMGFFIHDLHQQIQLLHQEQVSNYGGQLFHVYRGQGLSTADFETLKMNQGGLMSFNCFLSTSSHRDVPTMLAESSAWSKDKVGILFVMTIDPNITSIPFADIEKVSFFAKEAEILFSMHTVFRIGSIKSKGEGRCYFEVNLSLTKDDDAQLGGLLQKLDEDTQASNGWERMGRLLIEVGQPDKAEELYNSLLEQTSNPSDQGRYNHQLGTIKYQQGDFKEALSLYERALEIKQKILSATHPDLAISYNDVASVYKNIGKYSKALFFYERALKILRRNFSANHPVLAISDNNIGSVYDNMGEYTKALFFYERALQILLKCLPANHPSVAISYNNIGLVNKNMSEYSKVPSFFERAIEIFRKSLHANHVSMAVSYKNSASLYKNNCNYSKALSLFERALEIKEKSLPAHHPSLAISYNNIGSVYENMGEYPQALSFYERALEIKERSLPVHHHSLGISYNNIGTVYENMSDYSKALFFYERAIKISEKSLPINHPHLEVALKNMKLLKSKSNKTKL